MKTVTKYKSSCPVCDAVIELPADTEETEIITCPECENRLVVELIKDERLILGEAPEIEEDWGE